MNDTQHLPPPADGPPPGPEDDFDPSRLRSIADMTRSSDDRIVAGVCAGAARYLGIDPMVVRVVIAVLTLAGFAGGILYIAAWILLPSDDSETSLAAQWFHLDRNEEQVRVAGLVGAVVLAAISIVGDSSWAWWDGSPWWLLPVALIGYFFWVRPRRRRERAERARAASGATPLDAPAVRERPSHALLSLTLSLIAIAMAVVLIVDETRGDVPWTAYVAVALAVVGVGLLIGTFFGHSGGLILLGAGLALTLAIAPAFPDGRIGSQQVVPAGAADLEPDYRHGIGLLELDLTEVSDPASLLGRSIELDTGIGRTLVIVPEGLQVTVDTHLRAGEISLFGRMRDGTDVSLSTADATAGPTLEIDIDQTLGEIEVVSR